MKRGGVWLSRPHLHHRYTALSHDHLKTYESIFIESPHVVSIVLRDQQLYSIEGACTNISRQEETNLASKIEVEASADQSLRQESSVQESDSSVPSGSLTAGNREETKDQVDSKEEGALTMESFQMTKLNWMNVLFLGGGFFLLFTAFQTTAFVQVNTLLA